MTDIEISFCGNRGQVDVLVEQLERIMRFDIAATRRRAIASALIETVSEELAAAQARWTPAYDAILRDLLAAQASFEEVTSDDPPPWDEYGSFESDRDVVERLRRRVASYAHVLDRLADADGPLLSDAWAACDERADAIAMLVLAVDPAGVREQLRRVIIDHLASLTTCDCAPVVEATCLRAARTASLGGDWDAVERLGAVLWTFPHVRGEHCRPHAIAEVCRRDATLAELAVASEIMTFPELVARLGNPFAPATRPRWNEHGGTLFDA